MRRLLFTSHRLVRIVETSQAPSYLNFKVGTAWSTCLLTGRLVHKVGRSYQDGIENAAFTTTPANVREGEHEHPVKSGINDLFPDWKEHRQPKHHSSWTWFPGYIYEEG